MATHDVSLIERTVLRFLELEQGKLLFDGTDVARLKADLRGGGRR
jgi:ABC-type ATPase involved in cell division